jgi:hypothetical protein
MEKLTTRVRRTSRCVFLQLSLVFACSGSGWAADAHFEKELQAIRSELRAQAKQLSLQKHLLTVQEGTLAKQAQIIEHQRNQIQAIPAVSATATAPGSEDRAVLPTGTPDRNRSAQVAALQTNPTLPTGPVGEAPKDAEKPPQVIQSLPEGLAVLTPRNSFVVTPSVEFTHTSNDRLVYRGVVIVPGINIGEVDASSDSRNILSAVADIRYGLTSRLELEARIPFVWSDDRATVLSQGPAGSATQSIYLQDAGIGDVEVGARYQINKGLDDWPIFLANARFKTDTALGPFDIKRDPAGIAQQVALGSGFMGLEGGFSVLKLTDPAVLFGSVNYIYNLPKDINQTIGSVLVGRVEPSNSISATMGFGFSVNPDFSFSMGYEHSYVLPQYTELGTTQQQTTSLQVGALTLGMAYRLSPSLSFNTNFEFGVTSDAPDMRVVFSMPTTF